jgi:hypothetical protein
MEGLVYPAAAGRSPRQLWNRWSYRLFVPMLSTLLLSVFLAPGANAVHDTGKFQLDGNAQSSLNSTPPATEDWDKVCPTTSPPSRPAADPVHCLGGTTATPSSFVSDAFAAATDDVFTGGGSKDDLDISSWKWKEAAPSPDKDDLEHAYAAQYTGTSGAYSGHKLLFFGGDRFSNAGDANIAFWFFHNEVSLGTGNAGTLADPHCTLGSGCAFDASVHTAGNISLGGSTPGDILIVSAFTQGGTQPNIKIYEWVGIDNATSPCFTNECSLEPLPLPAGQGAACNGVIVTGDVACAIVNTSTIDSPWFFTPKAGTANTIPQGQFYEGGLDLTGLGLGDECFSSFLLNTRSSQSGDATLKDFALGGFGACTSGTVTTPKQWDGTTATNIPATGVVLSNTLQVKDEAVVTVTGVSTWSGTVSFFLCGPTPLSDASYTLCTSGGTAVGSPVAVSNPSPATVLSAAQSITAVGRYCFRAVFSGDASKGVPGSSDSTVGECFKVIQLQPSMDTAQRFVPNDSATITVASGGGNLAGTVVFKLFVNNATCSGTADYTSAAINITDGVPNSGTPGLSKTVASSNTTAYSTSGTTFHWIVIFTSSNAAHTSVWSPCGNEHSSITINNGSTQTSPSPAP